MIVLHLAPGSWKSVPVPATGLFDGVIIGRRSFLFLRRIAVLAKQNEVIITYL